MTLPRTVIVDLLLVWETPDPREDFIVLLFHAYALGSGNTDIMGSHNKLTQYFNILYSFPLLKL